MKASKIKVGHIYYVDFNPVHKGEFPDHHMALVIKKNLNNITYVVVPMTSQRGDARNKVPLGKLKGVLPDRLASKVSYAVIDQIRTVSADRFDYIYDDNSNVVDVELSDNDYERILCALLKDLLYDVGNDRKQTILENVKEHLKS